MRPWTRLCVAALAACALSPAASSEPTAAGYTISLPQTLRGTVQVPTPPRLAREPIDTLRDLYPALAACWGIPAGSAAIAPGEVTARLSLRRDGSVIGVPRITFATPEADSRARAASRRAALDAIRRCTPVAITPALGNAIAGRPIALRFVYQGPTGQGV